jgi:RNA polymerase sigma-70 factor (ECF subfamily)
MVRIAARDEAAFRLIVDRHVTSLIVLARRMLGDRAEAEDVAQETLLRLWSTANSVVDIGPAGIWPWLRRVASNQCIDRLRVARRVDVTDQPPEQSTPANQLSALVQKDLAARIEQALTALPERQRVALTLFHYEGLSMGEIGALLTVSEEAVESLLARARRALRTALATEWQSMSDEHSGPA